MCYVLDFDFLSQLKVCKFSEIRPTFQTINYLFYKEVCNPIRVKVLHNKKSRRIISDFSGSSIPFRSVVHVGNLTHQHCVH